MDTPLLAYAIVFTLFLLAGFLRARLDASAPWKRFFDMMFRVEVGVVTALLLLLVGVGFLQIVLRNFFQTGLLWGDPLMRHAVLWLGCLGASLATAAPTSHPSRGISGSVGVPRGDSRPSLA